MGDEAQPGDTAINRLQSCPVLFADLGAIDTKPGDLLVTKTLVAPIRQAVTKHGKLTLPREPPVELLTADLRDNKCLGAISAPSLSHRRGRLRAPDQTHLPG